MSEKKYKFRDLKIYASTEWLANNIKKYRQVFDRNETTYVYAELSLYNKKYDEKDWEVNVQLKCFSLQRGRKELCSLNLDRKVSKFDPIFFIREGWGNKKKGVFWKKGTYYWEAWVDGVKVSTKYFYVEDAGSSDEDENPYIKLSKMRLYEGPYDDVSEDDRVYYEQFSAAETRYIYTDLELKNLNTSDYWQCEIFIRFVNNARELKGQVIRLKSVKEEEETIKITAGWGSNEKGSWREGDYTVELIFMDKLLGIVRFEVGDKYIEGVPPVTIPGTGSKIVLGSEDDNETFEMVLQKLDVLIGLSEIKQKVRDHAAYINFLQLRKKRGFEEKDEINVHSVFIGNPGTGKTTVAKMMGILYRKMGLLSKGHVHEVDRVDLVGEYIGQTAPKVKEAIEKARGGVLFIDEAYALARANDDSKDFGREVIEILVKEMSNGEGDMAVIVAGYPKEMQHFLDSNPGLKSRFKHYFYFDDYLPQELSLIAEYAASEKEVVVSEGAKKKIDVLITEAFRNRDRAFGNARYVFDILEKAKVNLGMSIMKRENPSDSTDTELKTLLPEHIEGISYTKIKGIPNIPIDEKLLEESLADLDSLIGMKNIKTEIHELVQLVRYYRETGKNVLNSFYLHTVFIGNPGTGKTTVARILTRIYKALGVLERGHMVETDRQGLVAGFVGQTAIKTAEKIDEALGGVLFIDEAYSLTSSGGTMHDFGNEVVQTILKRMEDLRGKFFVFAAGYPDNMEHFLKANPGLSSRFDKILKFGDYHSEELLLIAKKMFMDQGLQLSPGATDHLSDYLQFLYERRDKYFGNARTVRNMVLEAIKNQNLRFSALDLEERASKDLNVITLDDVKEFSEEDQDAIFNKKRIGFRSRE